MAVLILLATCVVVTVVALGVAYAGQRRSAAHDDEATRRATTASPSEGVPGPGSGGI